MKVLFFLLDGETNASSRHRALQYFPLLARFGIDPVASRPVPEPLYQRWVELGSFGSRPKAAFYSLFFASRLLDVLRAANYDVVVVQRDLFPFGLPWLERLLRKTNPRIVYDTDDATYLRPSFNSRSIFQRLRTFDKVREVARHSRWVSVATEPIATWMRSFTAAQVSVVPMSLDPDPYSKARPLTANRVLASPVVLGWAGTAGGVRYLENLAPVLRKLASQFPIEVRILSGARRINLPGVPHRLVSWRREIELSEMAKFDVGLVPLDDNAFERAKFPFKMLQYFALGLPTVAAGVGVAENIVEPGENGLLARSEGEWQTRIAEAISNASLRQKLGAGARATVRERYCIDQVGPILAEGLLGVART